MPPPLFMSNAPLSDQRALHFVPHMNDKSPRRAFMLQADLKTDSQYLTPVQSPPLSQRLEPDLPCPFCVYRFFLPLPANNTGAIFPVQH
ncbi:hypothetical protein PSCICE_05650 [Pseudomonas cichorii]|nr:hypothetical protein PSCICE_05650 [Pseudomonas cichorii]